MKRFLNIAHFSVLAVALLMLSSLAQAIEPTIVRRGEITVLSVDSLIGDTYSWDIYNDSTVNFAVINGTAVADGDALFVNNNNTGQIVQVQWLETGLYFYKVTAYDITGCTNNLRMGMIKVIPALPTAKLTTTDICEGDPVKLQVDLTGNAPWNFTVTDGTNSWTESGVMTETYEMTITPGPKLQTSYWVTVVSDVWGINNTPTEPEIQVVNPKPDSSPIYKFGP